MTDEELAAIEARVQAATPGPWKSSEQYLPLYIHGPSYGDHRGRFSAIVPEDEAFIAHAREDVPALLAEVRRLRKIEEGLVKAQKMQEELANWGFVRGVPKT